MVALAAGATGRGSDALPYARGDAYLVRLSVEFDLPEELKAARYRYKKVYCRAELTADEWNKTLTVNLTGTFLTVKYAIPLLKERGGAVIITASVNGTRIFSNAGASAYSSSKAGQVAFTKMAALELAKHKIRVNVICPGAIETAIDDSTERRDIEAAKEPVEFPEGSIPLTDGAPGKAEQVADLVLFLASDAASHISGTEIWIDGAESLLQG